MAGSRNIKRIAGIVLVLALAEGSAAWASKCDLRKGISAQEGLAGPCNFDAQRKSFEGTPAQQATCLTREVKRLGNIGDETITANQASRRRRTAQQTDLSQLLHHSRHEHTQLFGGRAVGFMPSAW
jgi:hypothetical protein